MYNGRNYDECRAWARTICVMRERVNVNTVVSSCEAQYSAYIHTPRMQERAVESEVLHLVRKHPLSIGILRSSYSVMGANQGFCFVRSYRPDMVTVSKYSCRSALHHMHYLVPRGNQVPPSDVSVVIPDLAVTIVLSP